MASKTLRPSAVQARNEHSSGPTFNFQSLKAEPLQPIELAKLMAIVTKEPSISILKHLESTYNVSTALVAQPNNFVHHFFGLDDQFSRVCSPESILKQLKAAMPLLASTQVCHCCHKSSCNSLVGPRAPKSVLPPISKHDEEALHEFNFLRTDASTASTRASRAKANKEAREIENGMLASTSSSSSSSSSGKKRALDRSMDDIDPSVDLSCDACILGKKQASASKGGRGNKSDEHVMASWDILAVLEFFRCTPCLSLEKHHATDLETLSKAWATTWKAEVVRFRSQAKTFSKLASALMKSQSYSAESKSVVEDAAKSGHYTPRLPPQAMERAPEEDLNTSTESAGFNSRVGNSVFMVRLSIDSLIRPLSNSICSNPKETTALATLAVYRMGSH